MSEELDVMMQKMQEHFSQIDETVLVVLKGHLLIEEALDTIISNFVFHPSFIKTADLEFSQKLSIARSMSLDEHQSEMWAIASNFNKLRNELAHSLQSPKRLVRIQAVVDLFFRLNDKLPDDVRKQPEHVLLIFAIGFFLGFLSSFQAEVKRFRHLLDTLDPAINPHRHVNHKGTS